MLASFLYPLALATLALAQSINIGSADASISINSSNPHVPACSVANTTLSLPQEGDVEVVAGDVVKYIALAVGQTEYTCNNNLWNISGIKSSLYDISCQYNTTSISALSLAFNGLASAVMNVLDNTDYSISLGKSVQAAAGVNLPQLGTFTSAHGAVFNFDFSSTGGGSLTGNTAQGSGKLTQRQAAPIASYDIDWARFSLTSGDLAQEVYQVQTSGGIPATTGLACTNGATDNVPYSAQMWFYVSNANQTWTPAKIAANCNAHHPTTKAKKVMVILPNAVQYGKTGALCKTIADCTTKCLKVKNCVGFSLSTEDGQGYTKLQVLEAKLGYAFNFNSGIVRSITNKQYVDRQGVIHDCPTGQITAADYLGCVIPPSCN